MSKRSYRDDSFTESEKTNANGNGSRDSGRVLRKSELDNIASEEGFVFFKKLGLGNSLYSNKEGTLKRVYDKYGKVVYRVLLSFIILFHVCPLYYLILDSGNILEMEKSQDNKYF